MTTISQAAETLRVTTRDLREWMCFRDDPCPPGNPGAPCDVAEIAAWMGRTGRGQRAGRAGDVLVAARERAGGDATLAQTAALAAPPSGANQPIPSPDVPHLPPPPATRPAGEIPPFGDIDEERLYWDAQIKRLKAEQLSGRLIDKDQAERQRILQTQRLIKLLAQLPDRYSLLIADREEKECRRLLQQAVDEIRTEMSRLA